VLQHRPTKDSTDDNGAFRNSHQTCSAYRCLHPSACALRTSIHCGCVDMAVTAGLRHRDAANGTAEPLPAPRSPSTNYLTMTAVHGLEPHCICMALPANEHPSPLCVHMRSCPLCVAACCCTVLCVLQPAVAQFPQQFCRMSTHHTLPLPDPLDRLTHACPVPMAAPTVTHMQSAPTWHTACWHYHARGCPRTLLPAWVTEPSVFQLAAEQQSQPHRLENTPPGPGQATSLLFRDRIFANTTLFITT